MSRKKNKKLGSVIAGLAFGLAGGVALGTYVLAPNLPNGPVQEDRQATQQLATAESNAEIYNAQADAADRYIGSLAEKNVDGILKDKPVIVMTTSDADKDDVDNVTWLLRKSGAQDAGFIELKDKFFSQDGADSLKSLVANTLPSGAQLSTSKLDPGTHAGEALGSALLLKKDSSEPQAKNDERALLLGALKESGFISYDVGAILPAHVVIMITGDSDGTGSADFSSAEQAHFAEALDSRGSGVVVAGRIHTSAETGVVGRLRRTQNVGVSTEDSVDRAFGRMGTVLAAREQLDGHTGHYGTAQSAEAVAPAVPGN